MASQPKKLKTNSTASQVLLFFAVSILAGVLAAGLIYPLATSAGEAASVGDELLEENPTDLSDAPVSEPSTILAEDGTELATFYAENRESVDADEISDTMKEAVVAIEDERFYEHGGTDLRGLGRAVGRNLTSDATEGASTITHQYVSQLLINEEKQETGQEELQETTIADRLNEARLSVDIEEEMSKDEILAGYLNIVLLGGNNYGVEAAAQYYWGIPASELDLQQSATLAGLVQNPNGLNPETNPEAAVDRRNVVLNSMVKNGDITEEERDEAAEQDLNLDIHRKQSGCYSADEAGYFCDYVTRSILADEAFGDTPEERENLLNRGGLEIQTTLNADLQEEAQTQVEDTVPVADPSGAGASLVSVEPGTGNIRTMAQNTRLDPEEKDGNTTLNFNVDADMGGGNGFQAGSTIKPFIAAAWLEEGHSMADEVDASQDNWPQGSTFQASCLDEGEVSIPDDEGWSVSNVIEDMKRPMTVDYGMYWSINTATVATAAEVDLCNVTDILSSAGMHQGDGEDIKPNNPSFVLGSQEVAPLTQAGAFATFANDGEYCRPRVLESVQDGDGNNYDVPAEQCEQAMGEDEAAQLNETMQRIAEDRVAEEDPQFPMGGKTGTNNSESSTWFIGYSKGLSTASWVGRYTDLESLKGMTINGQDYDDEFWGSTLAAPMWLDFMNEAADEYSTEDFTEPADSDFDDPESSDRYSMENNGEENNSGGEENDDGGEDNNEENSEEE